MRAHYANGLTSVEIGRTSLRINGMQPKWRSAQFNSSKFALVPRSDSGDVLFPVVGLKDCAHTRGPLTWLQIRGDYVAEVEYLWTLY